MLGRFDGCLSGNGGDGGEAQLAPLVGLELDAQLERHDRVERPALRPPQRLTCAGRVAQAAAPAEEAPAIAFERNHPTLYAVCYKKMDQCGRLLGRAARASREQESAQFGEILAAHEQLTEGRVAFVIQRRRKHDFTIAGQPQTAQAVALVDDYESSRFKVDPGRHRDLECRENLLLAALELRQVWLEQNPVVVRGVAGRLPGCGPDVPALLIEDVDPQALCISDRIGHEAGQRLTSPEQAAAAAIRDPTGQPAIAKQMELRERCRCRRVSRRDARVRRTQHGLSCSSRRSTSGCTVRGMRSLVAARTRRVIGTSLRCRATRPSSRCEAPPSPFARVSAWIASTVSPRPRCADCRLCRRRRARSPHLEHDFPRDLYRLDSNSVLRERRYERAIGR